MRTISEPDYRDYQVRARDAVFGEFAKGAKSSLVVMPTGTGKTVLAGMCAEEAKRSLNRPTLFVAHREILIRQAVRTLDCFGLATAVEMGAADAKQVEASIGPVDAIVGSVQTLQGDRLMRWPSDHFGLIVIDECHRALADSYTRMLSWFTDCFVMGITATPRRGDEKNLGARFETKAFEYTLREAIRERWLVPIRTRTCQTEVSLRGIKLAGGDFSIGELEARIGPKIESLARGFSKEIGSRPSVAFLPDVGSAMAFAQVLTELGVAARYVAGSGGKFGMPRPERRENLESFESGETQVIVCNELLVEGWDSPRVEAVGIIRPTCQQYRYMQMVGRGTRPSPGTGKTDCLVVDFDWKTDESSKDLCSSVELFNDGSVPDDVFPVARKLAAERSTEDEPVDAMEVLEEAERIVRSRVKFRVRLTGKEEKYQTLEHDPVGVSKILDFKLSRKYDLATSGKGGLATPAQVSLLRKLGIAAPESLSMWGATKVIGNILKRKDKGLSSAKQVQALLAAGVDPSMARGMSFDEARSAIVELDAAVRTRKPEQATLF